MESKSIRYSASNSTPKGQGTPSKPVGSYDRPWRKAMSKNPLNFEMTDGSLANSPKIKGQGRFGRNKSVIGGS